MNFIKNGLRQISILNLATALAAQGLLANFQINYLGSEISRYETALAYFILGAFTAVSVVNRKIFTGNIRLGLACGIAIALTSWAGFRLQTWALPRTHTYVLLAASFLLGFLGRVNSSASEENVAASVLCALVLATLLYAGISIAVPKFGYGMTIEIFSTAAVLLSAILVFIHRLRNGWVALAAFILALTPLFVDRQFPRAIATDLTVRSVGARKLLLAEKPDRNFPGISQHQLYVDGDLRFNGSDEQTYYQCLANVPLQLGELNHTPAKNALVVGGGNGLAARNLLGRSHLKNISLVDADPIFDFSKTELKMRIYNLDSLKSTKVQTEVADPFLWMVAARNRFDLVLIDWPLANRIISERILSAEFFSVVKDHLGSDALLVVAGEILTAQALSQRALPPASSSLYRALEQLNLKIFAYVDGTTRQTFLMATPNSKFNLAALAKKAGLTSKGSSAGCKWISDWKLAPGISATSLARSSWAKEMTLKSTLADLTLEERRLMLAD